MIRRKEKGKISFGLLISVPRILQVIKLFFFRNCLIKKKRSIFEFERIFEKKRDQTKNEGNIFINTQGD